MSRGIIAMEKMKMRSPDMMEETVNLTSILRLSIANRTPGCEYCNAEQIFRQLSPNTEMKSI